MSVSAEAERVADATRALIDWATRVEVAAIPRAAASRAARILADDLGALVMEKVGRLTAACIRATCKS